MAVLAHDLKLRLEVANKIVLVTGSSDGIGARLAERLGAAGAILVLVARSADKLRVVGDSIRSKGGVAYEYSANLSSLQDCEDVLKKIFAERSHIDIFVSNAGRSIRRSVQYQAEERFHDFQRLMALNYFGALKMILGVLPTMKARRSGQIVHVSSFGVPMRQPRFAGYVASKAAMDAALQAIAAEVMSFGICTSSVYMPLVQTKMILSKGNSYDHFSLLSVDQASQLIEQAIITKAQEVMDFQSRFIHYLYFFLPSIVTFIMAAVYKLESERDPDGPKTPGKSPAKVGTKQGSGLMAQPVLGDMQLVSGPLSKPAKASSPTSGRNLKPKRSKKCLRALGWFLWFLALIEPILNELLYIALPFISALYGCGALVRDFGLGVDPVTRWLDQMYILFPITVLAVALCVSAGPVGYMKAACTFAVIGLAVNWVSYRVHAFVRFRKPKRKVKGKESTQSTSISDMAEVD